MILEQVRSKAFQLMLCSLPMSSFAMNLPEVVEHTLRNNAEVQSITYNNKAFEYYVDEARGGYYPQVQLNAYLGRKKEVDKADNSLSRTSLRDGTNFSVSVEQLLFDGGATSSNIDKNYYQAQKNLYKNRANVDAVISNSITAYLNYLKYKQINTLSQRYLKVYNDYLDVASEAEQISGEILDKVQAQAKINLAQSNLYENRVNLNQAKNDFYQVVGFEVPSTLCQPNIPFESFKLDNIDSFEKLLSKNNKILEQLSLIEQRRASKNQYKAAMIPTLKLKFDGIYDRDLLEEAQTSKTYFGKLELSYKLFSGGSDLARQEQEKAFLKEAQKSLDKVTKSVISDFKTEYSKYLMLQKRVVKLKAYVQNNQTVVELYKEQYEGGSRSFIDLLNAEREVYSSKVSLLDVQYQLYDSYYKIYEYLSSLHSALLNNPSYYQCSKQTSLANVHGLK